ncbi:hypothetical protein L6452_31324 [Arctium lappa]|uniref:Uncharacterized protein n=1 Tax=Arctium lappa TaxID=4217 RepID=A0ACB8ZKE7_ARCLA|nr:hypothetical protein L6452_31324 [Arctium lappa]
MQAHQVVDDDPIMDLEMQLLPSSPPSANDNGAAASTTTQLMHKLIRFIQSAIIFTEGTNHASRVSSSKSLDNNSTHLHDHQTARIDIMEDVEVADLSQTAPLLKAEDNYNTLVLRKQMRTLIYVLYSSQMFKASVATTAYVHHHETTQRSKPLVDETNVNKREIISKIVQEKNLQALEEFGDLIEVADALNTDLINGISDINRSRLQATASLCPTPPHGFSHFVLESLKNKTILLLSLAAALSLGFGIAEEGLWNGWHDGVIVLITIILLLLLASIRKYRQQHKDRNKLQIKKLQHCANGRVVHVIREGEAKYVSESELVCGDVILLNKGCQVPADGLFVNGQALELDYESESCIIDKQNPFLSYGERVINGAATMVVTSVNMNTRWSEVMMSKPTGDPKKRFELETHLDKLNTCIHYTGLIIGILILFVLFFRYMAGKMDEENGSKLESIAKPTKARNFANTFNKIVKESKNTARALTKLLSVSLIGVTEGVPFVVSLAIFYWNHITTLSGKTTDQDSQAVAKMGSATRICSDFAENEMEVDRLFIGGEVISACTKLSPNVVEALCDGFCTSTEEAVLGWAKEKFGLKRERMIQSSTMMYENESVKEILSKCTHYYHTQGEKYSSMDDNMRSFFEEANEDMQHKQLKTIAFACKLTDVDDFILVALVGLKSTTMEVIKAEVKEFRDCGIETVMVSSKKVSVLKDIALQCEVIAEGDSESLDVITTGEAFGELSEDERIEKVDKIRVLGGAKASDKLLFVEALRKKGEVVTFIGQRTDEAPVLREADIGISIGTWSSIKARESSDIFICEYGSFHDLIKIINSGKCIHSNIRRFLQLVLITTVSSTLINFYETVAFGDASLTTVELVCVNLAVDFLGGFALLTTSSTDKLLDPIPRGSLRIITAEMTRNILFQVLYQVICSVILHLIIKGPGMKTMVSSSFILSQLFNIFNARELQKNNFFKGIHQHKEFLVAVATFIVLYAAAVMGQVVLGYGTRLNWKQWAVCVGVGVMTWLVDWFGKCISMVIMILIKRYIDW